MRRSRRGGGFHQEFGGSGEDSFVAVVVTKLTGALLFILLLTMVIMALIPKADTDTKRSEDAPREVPRLVLEIPDVMPEAVVRRAYDYTFSVRGESTGPLVWTIREPLPEGLGFDATSGRLTGAVGSGDPESYTLTVQVTDGRSVAGAVTRLPVWNPEKEYSAGNDADSRLKVRDQSIEGWISQGFGLGLIWFGHFAGLGLIDRLQNSEVSVGQVVAPSSRFRWYKRSVWLLSLGFTIAIAYWMTLLA